MRDYIAINNYSGIGTIGISRRAIEAVALSCVDSVDGAAVVGKSKKGEKKKKKAPTAVGVLFALPSGVKVALTKEGKAEITIDVAIRNGVNVAKICEEIQQSVAQGVSIMCDTVPFSVRVKVVRIGAK